MTLILLKNLSGMSLSQSCLKVTSLNSTSMWYINRPHRSRMTLQSQDLLFFVTFVQVCFEFNFCMKFSSNELEKGKIKISFFCSNWVHSELAQGNLQQWCTYEGVALLMKKNYFSLRDS
ncbi:hypothetical protein BpHYR1_014058 [Brachionus plicatilis]|uniref:Uncharacterized protein n=1 Tax=Brachionus plicatilis TaxID=10195 RepID=A0A3M7T643_BRAPC|nr:hypothetical protein BpHYR1_014058 [Brachionus plicatilis]